jgi:hypothetical protein
MTDEALGTVLIAIAVTLAFVVGLPLLIGVLRLDGSRKRLLGYAAQLRGRTSWSAASGWPETVRTVRAAGGQAETRIASRRATLVLGEAQVRLLEVRQARQEA